MRVGDDGAPSKGFSFGAAAVNPNRPKDPTKFSLAETPFSFGGSTGGFSRTPPGAHRGDDNSEDDDDDECDATDLEGSEGDDSWVTDADEEEDGADAAASFSFSPPAISLGGSPAGSSPGGFTFASGQAAGGFSFTPPRMRSGSEEGEESPTY